MRPKLEPVGGPKVFQTRGHADPLHRIEAVNRRRGMLTDDSLEILVQPFEGPFDVFILEIAVAVHAGIAIKGVLREEESRSAGGGHRGPDIFVAKSVFPSAAGLLLALPSAIRKFPVRRGDLHSQLFAGPYP